MPQIPSGMSMMLKSLGFDADQFSEQLKGFQAGVMEKMTAAETAMKSADAKMDELGKRMLVIELALSSIAQKIHAENPIDLQPMVETFQGGMAQTDNIAQFQR